MTAAKRLSNEDDGGSARDLVGISSIPVCPPHSQPNLPPPSAARRWPTQSNAIVIAINVVQHHRTECRISPFPPSLPRKYRHSGREIPARNGSCMRSRRSTAVAGSAEDGSTQHVPQTEGNWCLPFCIGCITAYLDAAILGPRKTTPGQALFLVVTYPKWSEQSEHEDVFIGLGTGTEIRHTAMLLQTSDYPC